MARRVRRAKGEIDLPDVILRRVRSTALVLGCTSSDVAIAGCRLFCTYVLRELACTAAARERLEKGGVKWQVNELVKVLASRFGSRLRK